MLKIGILTFHRSINYGAFLQCYCLSTYLNSFNYIRAEVIDYQHLSVYIKEIKNIFFRGLYNTSFFKEIKKFYIFRKFQKRNLLLSKSKIISNSVNNRLVELLKTYDLIIVGSDEVWKIDDSRKFPNIYWTVVKYCKNVINFAVSANRTKFENLSKNKKKEIKYLLNKMKYIGVRDNYTFEQLKKINSNIKININSDPTFCYSLNNNTNICEAIEKKFKKLGINIYKPIIGITTGNKKIAKLIKLRFGQKYQIIAIGNNNKIADAYLYNFTPFEWAKVFHYLVGCISGFYHSTIFCIKNKTPFVAIDNENYYLNHESKIYDLLKNNNLLDCYFNAKNKLFSWKILFDTLENKIKNKTNEKKRMQIAEKNEKNNLNNFKAIFKSNFINQHIKT